jgi:hypothetical protein
MLLAVGFAGAALILVGAGYLAGLALRGNGTTGTAVSQNRATGVAVEAQYAILPGYGSSPSGTTGSATGQSQTEI